MRTEFNQGSSETDMRVFHVGREHTAYVFTRPGCPAQITAQCIRALDDSSLTDFMKGETDASEFDADERADRARTQAARHDFSQGPCVVVFNAGDHRNPDMRPHEIISALTRAGATSTIFTPAPSTQPGFITQAVRGIWNALRI